MIKIKYNIWPHLKSTGQVAIRVRWNDNLSKVVFITGVYAEVDKWDTTTHRAKKNTTHRVVKRGYRADEINATIDEFKDAIDDTMACFSLKNSVPTSTELKVSVNNFLGRIREKTSKSHKKRNDNLSSYLSEFLAQGRLEKNWDGLCCEKYQQAMQHLTKAVPDVTPYNITTDTMLTLKKWYIDQEYKNRTINKQIIMLKCFLRWLTEQDGIEIPEAVLKFKTNLKVMAKTVTFLHYNELIAFANHQFEPDKEHLAYARDLWCFMAFTSLRYSDLANLRTAHIIENRIELMTQKTSDRVCIPITDGARAILDKYKDAATADGHVFNVPANQNLNNSIKEAAEIAGLDRLIIDSYYIGSRREDVQHKFYEIISCHDARRTFVSCSLAMGIPAQVVMKATGHKSYNTMKPYIDTATETQALEMEKWNRSQYRSEIITLLDKASQPQLEKILAHLKVII